MHAQEPNFMRKVNGSWQVKIDVPSRVQGWVLNKKGKPVKSLAESLGTGDKRKAITRKRKVIAKFRLALADAELRRLEALEPEIRRITDYTPAEMASRIDWALRSRWRNDRLRGLHRRIRSGD
jgi:hypothetical protein